MLIPTIPPVDEWDVLLEGWTTVPFDQLEPDDMNQTTLKYAKSVMQLEKGLPPNGVVPLLKGKVDEMRDQVCFPFLYFLAYIEHSTVSYNNFQSTSSGVFCKRCNCVIL